MKLQDILKDAWEVAYLHYQFLHLGYFYSLLSKKINFSRIAFNINIETGPGQGFLLNREWIQKVLEEIYSRPQDMTTVEYLTLLNSVRGIVGAVREALDHKEFKKAFKKIFPEPNQEQTYLNFEGALRFIRNVLTHNIRDEIILQESDIRAWKKKGMGSKPIEFQYDYSSPNSPIHLPDCKAKVDIRIELDKIMPGKTRYFEIVNVFQNLMFAEFCYNALYYLTRSVRLMPVLEDTTLESEMEQFERDMNWIYTHYETLKREYPNEFVAVFNQTLVAHSPDIESLIASVQPRFGQQVGNIAIKFIYAEPPAIVLTPQ